VVSLALEELLADGRIRECSNPRGYILPNYIAAQETPSSTAQRKREERERRRDVANDSVTKRDAEVTIRDEKSRDVTDGHAESQDVTPCLAVPNQTKDPDVPDSSGTDVGPEIPDIAWTAADTLRSLVLKAQPGNRIGRGAWGPEIRTGKRRAWANDFRLLFESDKRTPQQLGEVLRWLFQGQTGDARFVVQSPDALRKKWDRIETQMGKGRGPPGSGTATPKAILTRQQREQARTEQHAAEDTGDYS
jgi:hypothetical protein